MSASGDFTKYDDYLLSILENEKSILGFLSAIFSFLGRRTDFYHVQKEPNEPMGFPPGVIEQLVLKVLKKCDPKTWNMPQSSNEVMNQNDEIMCSTVAQEVEVISEDCDAEEVVPAAEPISKPAPIVESKAESSKPSTNVIPDDYVPPMIPTQKSSDTYNGADKGTYLWSQTIMELDVTVRLPADIKSSKDLKVTINSGDICIAKRNGEILIKDTFPYKIKASEAFWTLSEGKLLIHFEKAKELWWNRFLNSEEPIDLNKIDCSRPLDELPEDHVAKVRELQWNQERKMKGLPTSDEIRNIEILKRAWNAEGSPFKGQEFDPSVLSKMQIS